MKHTLSRSLIISTIFLGAYGCDDPEALPTKEQNVSLSQTTKALSPEVKLEETVAEEVTNSEAEKPEDETSTKEKSLEPETQQADQFKEEQLEYDLDDNAVETIELTEDKDEDRYSNDPLEDPYQDDDDEENLIEVHPDYERFE